jgi:hypothetical protein
MRPSGAISIALGAFRPVIDVSVNPAGSVAAAAGAAGEASKPAIRKTSSAGDIERYRERADLETGLRIN